MTESATMTGSEWKQERHAQIANIYLVNAVVLISHEIDSAYWREWELFRLPGGIQLFLVLNLLLVGLVLWGFRSVLLWTRGARAFSYLLACLGFLAVLIHGIFLAAGAPEFRLPMSLALLLVTLVLSGWQFVATMQSKQD
jgi:hypothetical protein